MNEPIDKELEGMDLEDMYQELDAVIKEAINEAVENP